MAKENEQDSGRIVSKGKNKDSAAGTASTVAPSSKAGVLLPPNESDSKSSRIKYASLEDIYKRSQEETDGTPQKRLALAQENISSQQPKNKGPIAEKTQTEKDKGEKHNKRSQKETDGPPQKRLALAQENSSSQQPKNKGPIAEKDKGEKHCQQSPLREVTEVQTLKAENKKQKSVIEENLSKMEFLETQLRGANILIAIYEKELSKMESWKNKLRDSKRLIAIYEKKISELQCEVQKLRADIQQKCKYIELLEAKPSGWAFKDPALRGIENAEQLQEFLFKEHDKYKQDGQCSGKWEPKGFMADIQKLVKEYPDLLSVEPGTIERNKGTDDSVAGSSDLGSKP